MQQLQTHHIPDEIFHRDEYIQKINTNVFQPPLNGNEPENMFIYGGPGTGKTMTVKKLYRDAKSLETEDSYDSGRCVYINCKKMSTPNQAAKAIQNELTGSSMSKKPLHTRLQTIFNYVDENDVHLIVILDEVDRLFGTQKDNEAADNFIYSLVRAREQGDILNGSISLVCISNRMDTKQLLQEGTVSSFSHNWLKFDQYDEDQLHDILMQRCEQALRMDDDQLQLICREIAEFAAERDGDARTAINMMRLAGKAAQRDSRSTIKLDDIDEARYMAEKENVLEDLRTMPDQTRATFLALMYVHVKKVRRTSKNIKQFFDYLIEEHNLPVETLSERTIKYHLDKLDDREIIRKGVDTNARSRPTLYIPILQDESCEMLIAELEQQFSVQLESYTVFPENTMKEQRIDA